MQAIVDDINGMEDGALKQMLLDMAKHRLDRQEELRELYLQEEVVV